MAKKQSFLKQRGLVIVFLFLYTCLFSFKIISQRTPFFDWDESIYAQVGREMVANKSLVPLWQGQVWLDKPPLAPLLYGFVQLIPIAPEISTRLFTLALSVLLLGLVYLLYYRITKDSLVALFTVIITSLFPAFLQRSQVLNVDIFLLLGWVGYLLFYRSFWWGFFFLTLGVMSKSLLGFYPAVMILGLSMLEFFMQPKKKAEILETVRTVLMHCLLLATWYAVMVAIFGKPFIQYHIIESHFKRVTASIEQHFGQRTFYIDIIISELGSFAILSLVGIALGAWDYFRKRDIVKTAHFFFFFPWFLFLNLTKTKIAWYIYPVLPQFAFFVASVFGILKPKEIHRTIAAILFAIVLVRVNFGSQNILKTQYSQYDPPYYLAVYAKNACPTLWVLVGEETRLSYAVLKKMNLVISTTTWWGNHPAMVYYFGKPVRFLYTTAELDRLAAAPPATCVALESKDEKYLKTGASLTKLKTFGSLELVRKD